MNKKHSILCIFVLLSGCSSIISGTTQNITIESNAKRVAIYDSGNKLCETPCTLTLRRERSSKTLIAQKEGYEDGRIMLGTSLNLFFIGNLISTYGFTTDALTGSMWEYSPNQYYVNLMKDDKVQKKEELVKKEIRAFALKNYNALQSEAKTGKKGEYISSLSLMTGLDAEEIKELLKENVSAVLFTESVIDRYQYHQPSN